MSELSEVLADCPFCGKNRPAISGVIGYREIGNGESVVHARVECICGARGPHNTSLKPAIWEAYSFWNNRVETDKDKLLAELAAALEKANKYVHGGLERHIDVVRAIEAALSKYAVMKGEK